MASPFVGELRLVGFNFAPVQWAQCQGQLISISENPTLYNLVGTTYGGDGQTNFALPNLASRVPVHQGTAQSGTTYPIGQLAGVETVTLTVNQYPQHTHAASVAGSPQGTATSPVNNIPCAGQPLFGTQPPTSPMNAGMISPYNGQSLPHDNLQPYLALNWIIALYGIYPSQ